MTPDDVPQAEMFNKPRFRFHFGEHADVLTSGALQSAEWYDVADLLDAAAAPASASELAGEREIIAAFQREHLESVSTLSQPANRRSPVRSRMLNSLLTSKIAAALAASAVGVTGAATAAYANVLPDTVQDIAHHLIAAPPAHSHASETGRAHGHQFATPSPSPSTSVSPSASPSASASDSASPSVTPSVTPSPSTSLDPAAFGLCTAWSNAIAHDLQNQVGFRDKLAKIAGGDNTDDAITSFCATVPKPGDEASDSAEPTESPTASATTDDQNRNRGNSQNAPGHVNGDSAGNGDGHGSDAPGRS